MDLPRAWRHRFNQLTARYGRLRVNVTLGWGLLSLLTLAVTVLIFTLAAPVSTQPLLGAFLAAFLLISGLTYAVLHYGVLLPLESFRRNAKGQLLGQEEQAAQLISLNYELRRRTDQLQSTLDDNERLRERLGVAESRASQNSAVTQNLVGNLSDLVAYVDANGLVTEISPLACEFVQLHRSAVVGKPFSESFALYDSYRDNPREYPLNYLIEDLLKQRSSVPKITQALLITGRKEERKVNLRAACALTEDGVPVGVVVRILGENDLLPQGRASGSDAARSDTVTGLQSDARFDLRLRELIDIARSQKTTHALLLCSPDNLASVTEEHGLRAGDELLWRTARLVEEHVPAHVELYRVGLDVIGLVCPFSELAQHGDLADRLCLASAGRPFVWGEGSQHDASLSVGGVEINSLSEGVEPLLQKAHRALVSARHAGGEQVRLEVPDEITTRRRRQDDDWISWLLPRLESGAAHLSSQAILTLDDDPLRQPMFEIFIRIEDEDGVWVTPDYYMPALERRQLSHKLDLWVVERTLQEMAVQKSLLTDYACACINLSGWSLSEPRFGDLVHALITRYGVSPEKLCFEITEQQVASHLSETLRFMRAVQPLGVKFSLDRYRAMGGLHGLKDAPLDFVKIHPSLTHGLRNDPADPVELLHLSWVNKVCAARGITTIALGIEHEQTVRALKTLGISYAQGVILNKLGPVVT